MIKINFSIGESLNVKAPNAPQFQNSKFSHFFQLKEFDTEYVYVYTTNLSKAQKLNIKH